MVFGAVALFPMPPALPTLTERSPAPLLEAIDPWLIGDLARHGVLEPGFVDEFDGQDSLGRSVCRIEAVPGAVIFTIGGEVQRLATTYTACGEGRRPW